MPQICPLAVGNVALLLLPAAVLMFLAPTQRWIMRQLHTNRRLGLKQTDARLQLVQEVMSGVRALRVQCGALHHCCQLPGVPFMWVWFHAGIRIIKFMSWEESFVERIGADTHTPLQ